MIEITQANGGCLLSVWVKPKCGRNEIQGAHAGCLRIAVSAAPERGKANEAVVELLSRKLGISKSRISIARGQTNPRKLVRIEGWDLGQLQRAVERLTAAHQKTHR